jgi:hypothetical protein
MDVKIKNKNFYSIMLTNTSGQSLIEFLFFLPLMIGIFYIIFLTNNAIQISIVNQKYVRSQTLFLNLNSPVYPRIDLREAMESDASNMFTTGVSGNVNETGGDTYPPEAATQSIVRPRSRNIGSEDPQAEPNERGLVRVRTTLTICTQPNFVLTGNNEIQRLTSAAFAEGVRFDYCRSRVQ